MFFKNKFKLISKSNNTHLIYAIFLSSIFPAQAQDYRDNDTTSGPFNIGSQNFYDNSIFDANSASSVTGGGQTFNDHSILNASATDAIMGGEQTFYNESTLNASAASAIKNGTQSFNDDSILNASAADAINGGAQSFINHSTLNVSAANAIKGGEQYFYNDSSLNVDAADAVNGGKQSFFHNSFLDASEANTVNGGEQAFWNNSTLNASTADAVKDGIQNFWDDSTLIASAADAVNGGVQSFSNSSGLNANTVNAISGGKQIFYNESSLNTSAADAVNGGVQSFYNESSLNASAANAIKGGKQTFYNESSLNASAANAVNGGEQSFLIYSTLVASVADAIKGGEQTFYNESSLNASAANAISGGIQKLNDNSVLNVQIDNALTTKTDISFNNGYGGFGGTLQLNGHNTVVGALNSIETGSGLIVNGGATDSTLTVDTSQLAPATFSGKIQDGIGDGILALNIAGGQLNFGGTATHTGGTHVAGGTLLLDMAGQITGSVNVAVNGILGGIGTVGTTINEGILAPGIRHNNIFVSYGSFTIKGDYTSVDGILDLNTYLGDASSQTDVLIIDGGNATGTTSIRITNMNTGNGALVTGDGIKVVNTINGATTAAGSFELLGNMLTPTGEQAVSGGAYAYTLHQNGVTNVNDGNWYLRSELRPGFPVGPIYHGGSPTYESYAQSLLDMNSMSTLQQRVGNRLWAGADTRVITQGEDIAEIRKNGIWGRLEGGRDKIKPHRSTSDTTYKQNLFKMQAGMDFLLSETETGKLLGGITAHYAHGKTKTKSAAAYGTGEISTDGYGIGSNLTWYDDNGLYVDGQGQLTWYRSDLSSEASLIGALKDGNKGFGYAFSVEAGKQIAIRESLSVTPQAQLIYSNVSFDDFKDAYGTPVRLNRGDSLQGRLGLSVDRQNIFQNAIGMFNRTHIYALANLNYEFMNGTHIDVAGMDYISAKDHLWGSAGAGGSYNWNNDKYSIYGEGNLKTSLNNFGDSYGIGGNIGFRMKW